MEHIKGEFKLLLLKDLSARLPYGVKMWYKYATWKKPWFCASVNIPDESLWLGRKIDKFDSKIPIIEADEILIKPYLRPMSSMTEEEKEELSHLLPKDWSVEIDKLNNFYFDMSPSIFIEIDMFLNIIDWLNKNHFDYCRLIPKGLALAVTENNNPYKE